MCWQSARKKILYYTCKVDAHIQILITVSPSIQNIDHISELFNAVILYLLTDLFYMDLSSLVSTFTAPQSVSLTITMHSILISYDSNPHITLLFTQLFPSLSIPRLLTPSVCGIADLTM